ncbi:hypothetical protein JTB14_037862 [Gonioctena quinquepunctata]|nr:hypothetical protein JTB14_037862 [Gonioctena quinquepunctata]
MPSNTELKVSRAKALRQTAINRLTLISESAALAKTNSEDQTQFKVRHRDLKKVIKDFEKHHNTILTLLAEDEAKLKEEHEHDEEFVKQCQALGLKPEDWDFIITHMLLERLDPSTRKSFEQNNASTDIPKYEDVKGYINKQCTALESVVKPCQISDTSKFTFSNTRKQNYKSYNVNNNSHNSRNRTAFLVIGPRSKIPSACFLCRGPHIIYRCHIFQSKTPQQRYEIIKTQKACINCLATAHTINQCPSEKRCRSCSKPHHSLLHFPANVPLSFSENVSRASNSNAPERSEVASEFSDTASHSHVKKTTTVAFLAIRCISQLAADYNDLPLASEVLRNSVYVDDIIFGHNSPQTIPLMKAQLVELSSRAGFEARK